MNQLNQPPVKLEFRRIKDGSDPLLHLNQFLSLEEVQRSNTYTKEIDAALFRMGRTIIRKNLGALHNQQPKSIPILISPKGKPYCPLKGSPNFSIAHCKNLLVVAWSNSRLGIDVEPMDSNVSEELEGMLFSDAEKQRIRDSINPDHERLKLFVSKESLLKAIGEGFLIDPVSISLPPLSGKQITATYEGRLYQINQCLIGEKWVIALSKELS